MPCNEEENDPWFLSLTPEQYQRVLVAAASQGLSVKEWVVQTIRDYAQEQIEIESINLRRGLTVVEDDPDDLA